LPEEAEPVFVTWRPVTPRQRGWPRRPAVVKAKRPARPPKVKKGPAELDAYGYRAGSPGALINAVLAEVPSPAEEIARATGMPMAKVSDHLREMIRRGHISVSPAGFATK
jgi:hypothetical protein